MWGNRAGWITSVVMCACFGLIVWAIAGLNDPTPPTDDFLAKFRSPVIKTSVESLVPAGQSGDAAPFYQEALQELRKNKAVYVNPKKAPAVDADLPAFEAMVKAAPMAQMTLFSANPGALIDYNNVHPDLDDLVALSLSSCRHGLRVYKSAHPASQPVNTELSSKGLRYVEAVMALGNKLYKERVTFEEYKDGLQLMSEASVYLTNMLEKDDPARAQAASALHAEIQETFKTVTWLFDAIHNDDPNVTPVSAGDVFYLVNPRNRAKVDPMWQVEALRSLGRLRWSVNAGGGPNQRMADRRCRELLNDPNPVIRFAAALGHNLTADEYHNVKW